VIINFTPKSKPFLQAKRLEKDFFKEIKSKKYFGGPWLRNVEIKIQPSHHLLTSFHIFTSSFMKKLTLSTYESVYFLKPYAI
jgi:hypothetical protein